MRRWSVGISAALLALLALGWLAALASGYDVAADVDVTRASAGPSAAHLLGTDHLGRDVATRLLHATKVVVGPALAACLIALGAGVTGGALAGWFGGWAAAGLRYGFTVLASVPRFIAVLLACVVWGPEVEVIAVAAGVAYAPTVAEAVFGRIVALKSAGFVTAARAHGVPGARVLLHHLLWVNCRHLLARHALGLFAFYLLLETTLSYIGGFGVPEPTPSWGNMLAFEWGVHEGNPWATWAPALAIWGALLASAALGDALAEGA